MATISGDIYNTIIGRLCCSLLIMNGGVICVLLNLVGAG